jgi:hypothetical protein
VHAAITTKVDYCTNKLTNLRMPLAASRKPQLQLAQLLTTLMSDRVPRVDANRIEPKMNSLVLATLLFIITDLIRPFMFETPLLVSLVRGSCVDKLYVVTRKTYISDKDDGLHAREVQK